MSKRNRRAMRAFDREHFCWFDGRTYAFAGPASVDRNPQGQDRGTGLGAEHESAAAKPDAQEGPSAA